MLPAAALARTPQVLRDLPPSTSYFKDRVTSSDARVAHASVAANWRSYQAVDGTVISAAISDRYTSSLDPQVVQSYIDFLDSLPHGPELASLRVYVAPPDEVLSDCGGQPGTLACYDSGTKIMVVPGEQTDTATTGVTTSYVITHEYGHHIAASRDNAPFNAFRMGPKYWSSYEMVCDRTVKGLLFPGNEDVFYRSNPGEAWAETYARLKYPDQPWDFTTLLKPDQPALDAATRDVMNPWSHNTTKVFKGSFSAHGSRVRRFSFDLTLDGALRMRLHGPKKANYNLSVVSNGQSEGGTKAAGSRDSLSYPAACRQSPVEHVTISVKRVTGSGPFTLRATYAG